MKINSVKYNEKARSEKKRVKRNKQSLQEIWDYVKRPNLCLIGIPECDGENESKLENTSEYYPGELPQPSKAGQHSSPGNMENTTKIFLRKSNPKAHNHQIQHGLNTKENTKGSQRERSGHPQREAHQTHSRSLGRKSTSQKRVKANIQHP